MSDNESDKGSHTRSDHSADEDDISISDIESGKKSDNDGSDDDQEIGSRKKRRSSRRSFFSGLMTRLSRRKKTRSFVQKDPFEDLSPSTGWTNFVVSNYHKTSERLLKSADQNTKLFEWMSLIRALFVILIILFLFVVSIIISSTSTSSSVLSALSALLILIHEILRIDERRFGRLDRSRRQRAVADLLTSQISRPVERRLPLPIQHYRELVGSWSSLHDPPIDH